MERATRAVTIAADSAPPTRCEFILPLAKTIDPRVAGDKAANLARLAALGAPVPDAFIVSNAALATFIDANDLDPLISALCRDLEGKTDTSIRCAAETIAALFDSASVPDDIGHALGNAWRTLSAPRTIVRSSAVGEDSDAASFAGQLDSVPDVADEGQLRRALVRVWASRWSHRALAYQIARGITLAGMGVVVQRQIESAVSGVLFTRAPHSPVHMLLEYCGGMGESLVSGRVNPGRITIAREGLAWSQDAVPDPPVPQERSLVNDLQIASLARTALEIERAFGPPQDIEWTMDARGRLWVVQARPITVSVGAAHSTAAPPRDEVLWSNANVNENFPQPISPLLYSIASLGYYHYFRNLGRAFGISARRLALMEQPLRHIIGVHGARMYYNLTSIHGVLRSAPFGDLLTASFNQFVGAAESARTDERASFAARARGRVAQSAEVAVIAFTTARQYLSLTARVERFERTVTAFAARTRPDLLETRPGADLLEDFRGVLDIRCNRWNDAALADAASMVCYGVLQRLLAKAFPLQDQPSLHNTLLKALPDLVSSQPALLLWDLSRQIRGDVALQRLFATSTSREVLSALEDQEFGAFASSLRRYLDEWGFRCSGELMLTTPSFQEQPEGVIELLKSYAAMDAPSPVEQLQRQASERLEATARVFHDLRARGILAVLRHAPAIAIALRWTQRSIQLRERARLKQALLYSRLRRLALAIGARLANERRIAQPDDVFFLTADEIDALLSGHAMFPDHVRQLVALRRDAHAELGAMTPPDSMRLRPGEYLDPTACTATAPEGVGMAAVSLTGAGACGGRATGRAVVLERVTESDRITRGDVLVTRQTDPGWGPIFPLIAGLVIERGGMLSHGAIIAREFGIPAVVGVSQATRRIPGGSRITVDGDRGVVLLTGEARSC